jgi:hypothetical protein
MIDLSRTFDSAASSINNRRAVRNLLLWISLFFLFSLIGRSTAEAAEGQSGLATLTGPGPQFAIADFDGDVHPDLASIQTGSNNSGTTTYWIQLHLSTIGLQSIRLVASPGGLRIKARDVNGDHAIDLVIATAWFDQPVAVLLNDGHGGFSRAEPSIFPRAFSKPEVYWACSSIFAVDSVAVLPQSCAGVRGEREASPHDCSPSGLIAPSSSGFLASSILIPHAGRAPPSEIPYF